MFDRIKRIFKKNKSNEVGIVTLDNIVSVPNRKDLNNDKKTIKKIDKYKTDYLKILTNKNTLTSHKLGEYNHISEKVRMYTDIYTSISLDEDELFEYTISNKDELVLRKVDIKNKLLKINLYLNDLEKLEKEIILHLIALKEIRNEKVFFSQLRKRPLEEEINTLTMSLINISSQKRAIEIETNTSLKNHELLDILNEEVSNEEQELIETNYNCLKRLINNLNIKSNINSNNKLLSISQIEKDIEEYAYNNKLNKDELMIDVLKEQLNNLKDKLSKSDNPESYMSLIKYYERKCIKYKKEGLITEEEMILLYELKFYILTSDINSKDKINIREISTSDEFEYYKKIMGNILKTIFESERKEYENRASYNMAMLNTFKEKLYFKTHKDIMDNTQIGTSKFEPYIKNIDYTRFKYYEILGDKEILSLILGIYKSFDGFTDSKNTLENFFKVLKAYNNKMKEINMHGATLVFDKNTPLITEYYLSILSEYYYKNIKAEDLSSLFDLYPLSYRLFLDDYYRELSGLKIIKASNYEVELNRLFYKGQYAEINNLKDAPSAYKAVYETPSTLRKIEGPALAHLQANQFILNDGLETLSTQVFKYSSIDELIIPSSLRKIDDSVFDYCTIGTLIIKDADNLQLDDDSLHNLLSRFIYIDKEPHKRHNKTNKHLYYYFYNTDINVHLYLYDNKQIILTVKDKQVKITKEDIDAILFFNSYALESLTREEFLESKKKTIVKYFRDLIDKKLNEIKDDKNVYQLK